MRKYLLHVLIVSFVLFLSHALQAASVAEEEKDRLLVVPLKAKGGINQDEVTLLTDILSVEIHRSGKFTILNREDMKAVLSEKEFELAIGCDDNVCLLENVERLAVNKLIAGNIGKLGKKYIISIRLINEDGHNEVMEKESCDCAIEELDKSIEKIAYKLLKYLGAEVTTYGSFRVESEPSKAKIYIDGSHLGTTPDVIRYIEPGQHKVEIMMDGYKTWSKEVDVKSSEEKVQIAILQKKASPINIDGSSVYTSKSSKTYHRYNCSELSTDNLIKFDSSQEANDAGAFPCKLCNPSQQVPVRVTDRQVPRTSTPFFQNKFLKVTLQSISKSRNKREVNLVLTLENILNKDLFLGLQDGRTGTHSTLLDDQGIALRLDKVNGIGSFWESKRNDKENYSVFNPGAINTIVMTFYTRKESNGTSFSFSADLFRLIRGSATRFSIGIPNMRLTQ